MHIWLIRSLFPLFSPFPETGGSYLVHLEKKGLEMLKSNLKKMDRFHKSLATAAARQTVMQSKGTKSALFVIVIFLEGILTNFIFSS